MHTRQRRTGLAIWKVSSLLLRLANALGVRVSDNHQPRKQRWTGYLTSEVPCFSLAHPYSMFSWVSDVLYTPLRSVRLRDVSYVEA